MNKLVTNKKIELSKQEITHKEKWKCLPKQASPEVQTLPKQASPGVQTLSVKSAQHLKN